MACILSVGLVGCKNYKEEAETLQAQNSEMSEEMQSMTQLRDQLLAQVDSLSLAYEGVASENEGLKGNLSSAQADLDRARAAVDKAKRAGSAQANDLQAQIQALIEARSGLEGSLAAMQRENDSLKTRTGVLEMDLARTTEEKTALTNLNQSMELEVERLTLDNFKASAFQVGMLQKNNKVTTKRGRARTIAVSFDLANVPAKFQGVRPIYLVVSDEKGTPITGGTPVRVSVNGDPMDIQAVVAREENIGESQRVSMTYDLEDKLAPGYYRAAVYTDLGMLGASSFVLR